MVVGRTPIFCAVPILILLTTYEFTVCAQTSLSALVQAAGPIERTATRVELDDAPVRVRVVDPVPPPEAEGHDIVATVTLRTTIDATGAVVESRLVGFEFATNDFSARMAGGEKTAFQLETILAARQARRAAEERPSDSVMLRPLLEGVIKSALAAVQQWVYAVPRDGALVFDIPVHFAQGHPRLAASLTKFRPDVIVGGEIPAPAKTRDVPPVYPQAAIDQGVSGIVGIRIRILEDGRVDTAQVVRSVPLLDEAALEAVRQWEFAPTLIKGVATPVVMMVSVPFRQR
jgi:TonB family protein